MDAYGFQVRKSKNWVNKQRTLLICSRGINAQGRYLMIDINNLLPHSKKEVITIKSSRNINSNQNKIEKVEIKDQVNELCTLSGCNNVLYFECRKKRDLYLWLSKFPNGPSTKFHVENSIYKIYFFYHSIVHTSEELRMTGNCLKGSRPLLSFDAVNVLLETKILTFQQEFDDKPHFKLVKELLIQTFGTPNMHPKSKPFYDHIFAFSVVDNRIWFRNYQVCIIFTP